MAQSLNTKVMFIMKVNVFIGWIGNKYGDILVGDLSFEFYNEKNPGKYFKKMSPFVGEENIVRRKPLFTMRNLLNK